jgi:hypothetical protein
MQNGITSEERLPRWNEAARANESIESHVRALDAAGWGGLGGAARNRWDYGSDVSNTGLRCARALIRHRCIVCYRNRARSICFEFATVFTSIRAGGLRRDCQWISGCEQFVERKRRFRVHWTKTGGPSDGTDRCCYGDWCHRLVCSHREDQGTE